MAWSSKVLAVTLTSFAALASAQNSTDAGVTLGPSTYTVPGAFPTSLYSSYFNNPTATSAAPEPVISDPVLHKVFAEEVTDPINLPANNTRDPRYLPPKASESKLLENAKAQILSIRNNTQFDTCAACQASLVVAKFLSLAAPEQGPELAAFICETFAMSSASTCANTYLGSPFGGVLTQVFSYADVGGFDGHMMCYNFFSKACPIAPAPALNFTGWFAKPKPDPLPAPRTPSGERLKVLHLSDVHLDPRYAFGSEANCTTGHCCSSEAYNSASPNVTLAPAPRYGAYDCDSPINLVAASFNAIPVMTETTDSGFNFTLYTGDAVTHAPDNELSRDFVEETEYMVFDLIKRMLGPGPVYSVLGNHDTGNVAQDAIEALGGDLSKQYSWNYDHVSSLWELENWINEKTAKEAKAHYAAYSVQRKDGLRIITLNTDLWYRANWFAYINQSHIDPTGMFRFLTDELQAAEDAGERAWILGHVLPGWDGTNTIVNPSNVFYQIVDRFSPHVIAASFFGHTHEDELGIFYANNATNISAETAVNVFWAGPSITPITNLNSGFRMYEVDSATFDIIEAHTWRSDVNAFPELDSQISDGPTWVYEYSTRDTYGTNITWPADAPLNGTWWHLVTEQMEANPDLVSSTWNSLQGKQSVRVPECTGDCIPARICYIRSASSAIGLENCIAGYGSVQ